MPRKKINKHELESIALAYCRCSCKWEFRLEKIKDKTDEELAIETGYAWEEHKKVHMDKK